MKRLVAISAVALLALLVALPLGLAAAQEGGDGATPRSANVPPAFLFGTAMSDGLAVPDGEMIVAMVGDEKVGEAMTMAGGKYELTLMQPSGSDNMVSFMVGERATAETYEWMSGGREANFTLTANLGMTPAEPGDGGGGRLGRGVRRAIRACPVRRALTGRWGRRVRWVRRVRRVRRGRRARTGHRVRRVRRVRRVSRASVASRGRREWPALRGRGASSGWWWR